MIKEHIKLHKHEMHEVLNEIIVVTQGKGFQ